MTRVLAIDPGSAQSAWLLYDAGVGRFGIEPNDQLLARLRSGLLGAEVVVIENIEPRYGLHMGWETLDTARLIGRLEEAARWADDVVLLRRSGILRHLGVITSPRKGEKRVTADSGVRQALMDRFGGPESTRKGGPLHGVSKDVWSALAIAVTYVEQEESR